MKNKMFIVGVGRSGTSLLQSMLNAHSEIAFIPETQFLRKYVFQSIEFKSKKEFILELNKDSNFRRAGVKPDEIVKEGNSCLDVYNSLLDVYLIQKGKKAIGDKDPRNIDFIPQLKSSFPDSKIIHIIRDPRDVVLSRTKADWSKHWPFNLHSYLYNAQLSRGRRLGNRLFGKNYYEIFYENLILSPEAELQNLCDFIQVEFEVGMLEFGSSAKELVDETEMQWKKETMGPLLSTNKNKWKKEFSASQIDLIQKVCASTFKFLPYQKEKTTRIFAWNNIHKIGAGIFKTLYPIRVKFLKK